MKFFKITFFLLLFTNQVWAQSLRFNKTVTTISEDKISPVAIAVDYGGTIYFSDESHVIYRRDVNGNLSVLAGTVGKSGFVDGDQALFSSPKGICISYEDGDGPYLYVADYDNNAIRKVDSKGNVSTLLLEGSLQGPYGIASDDYSFYVSEVIGNRIRRLYGTGQIRQEGPGNKKGLSFIVETYAGSGNEGSDDGEFSKASFNMPLGIACRSDLETGLTKIYVADAKNNKIRVIKNEEGYKSVYTLAGTGLAGAVDGGTEKATFNGPCGIAINAYTEDVYVSDQNGQYIRLITSSEEGEIIVTKYAGTGEPDFLDGTVMHAKFKAPMGLALYSENYNSPELFVADNGNMRIRQIGRPSLKVMKTTYGTPSESQMVYVSGENLLDDLVVTSDYGFEIADDPKGPYSEKVSFSPKNGVVADQVLYVRLSAFAPVSWEGGISTELRLRSSEVENIDYLFVMGEVERGVRTIDFQPLDPIIYEKDKIFTITATVTPKPSEDQYLIFTSGESPIVSVTSEAGVGYGRINKPGTDTVKVTAIMPGDEYYNEVSVQRHLIIIKKPQTITFDSLAWKAYGDESFFLAASSSQVGLNKNITYSTQDTIIKILKDGEVEIIKPGIATIIASQVGDDTTSAAAPVTRKLVIEKANQTVYLDEFTDMVTFGAGPIQLSGSASSDLDDIRYFSSDTSVIEISDDRAIVKGAGQASIWAYQEGNEYYKADTSSRGVITVLKADQTISFPEMAVKNIGDAPFVPMATASSGLRVSYTSENQAVAIVSGDSIRIVGAGITKITASQAGDKNYNAAKDSVLVLKVRSSQTINFPAIATKTYGDPTFTLPQFSSAGLTIIYESSDNAVATVSGNVVTIVGVGNVIITATQPGDGDIYGPAAKVERSFFVKNKSLSIGIAGATVINIGEIKEYRIILKKDSSGTSNITYHYDWFYVKNSTPPVFTPAMTDQNRFVTSDGSKVKVSFPADFSDSRLAAIVSSKLAGATGEGTPFDTVYYNVVINKVAVPAVSCSDTLGCSAYKITSFEYAGVALDQKALGIQCPAESYGYSDFATAQYLYDSLGKTTSLSMKVPKLFTSAEMYVAVSGDTAQYYGFWLDSDANGSFGDPGEFLGGSKTPQITYSGKLAIPNNEGASGTRRLRVKSSNAPLEAGSYCIVDKARNGETEDYLINLEPYPELKAPEAFTPGTDGYNDVFIIRGIDPARSQKSLKIFDQFGREVYAQEDYDNRWGGIGNSGEMLPNGTYFYEFSNGDRKINGFLELVAEK